MESIEIALIFIFSMAYWAFGSIYLAIILVRMGFDVKIQYSTTPGYLFLVCAPIPGQIGFIYKLIALSTSICFVFLVVAFIYIMNFHGN